MGDGGAVRVEPTVPPVPSDLLAPLLGVAADVLQDLEEAPAGLVTGDGPGDELVLSPSDDALRVAIEQDASFRRSVSARFMEDPRALDALDGWGVDAALDRVRDAAATGTLPILVSALYASRPTGWGYGLGAACAVEPGGAVVEGDRGLLAGRRGAVHRACARELLPRGQGARGGAGREIEDSGALLHGIPIGSSAERPEREVPSRPARWNLGAVLAAVRIGNCARSVAFDGDCANSVRIACESRARSSSRV